MKKVEKRDFLLELGMEEIPAGHFGAACEWLKESFISFIQASRLGYEDLLVSGTPRRFFIRATQVPMAQTDLRLERSGPALKISYKEDGELTPAALGFLKKNNASPSDIYIQKTDKGDVIAVSIRQKGKSFSQLLQPWLEELLPKFPFPKKMIWKNKELAFSRPLRWICLLFGDEPLPLQVYGISSGNVTFGNRYLGLERPLQVTSVDAYLPILNENSVIADREERLVLIQKGLESAALEEGHQVAPDERLAETVCDLVEYPSAVVSSFDERFLRLPEKIIISTISQNQKYFCVKDASGKLASQFVFISNGDVAKAEIIKKGNEKVVNARLEDALWYFEEDTRQPLESYLPALEDVVFHAKLGTLADKVRRITALCEWMCSQLNLPEAVAQKVLRTARLAKADLVTSMLGEKEFTKLQGYIGKQYALVSQEDEEVAEGIWEHYAPRGSNDALPQSLTGAVVAIADKLDTICGMIGVGLIPTGSADPFALRRLALGLCQILLERGWELSLQELVAKSFAILGDKLIMEEGTEAKSLAFIRQRVEWLLKQEGIAYDVIDSLEHLPISSLASFESQALALGKVRETDDFMRLVIGFKRVANILDKAMREGHCNPQLFAQEEERTLYEALQGLQGKLDDTLAHSDYDAALHALIDMGQPIDQFFDAVLVNTDDEALKNNRLALLSQIHKEFLKVADISKIVVEG
ncbi:MAG: glycine--tRNA ligase subunit beta [Candidatus Cloacimonetes bacterium]|nr:glycine--tRNA ligase subunit beta [Candidatus Cloacimonadota bacterium]